MVPYRHHPSSTSLLLVMTGKTTRAREVSSRKEWSRQGGVCPSLALQRQIGRERKRRARTRGEM